MQYQVDTRVPATFQRLRSVKEGETLQIDYGPKGAGTSFKAVGRLSLTVQTTQTEREGNRQIRRLICVDARSRMIRIDVYPHYHVANVEVP